MTTQGPSDNDMTEFPDAEESLSAPEDRASGRLILDLAECRETLVRGRALLDAALADGSLRQDLSELARDLDIAADQIARAERLAEVEAHRDMVSQRDREALVASLAVAHGKITTLRDRIDAAPSDATVLAIPVARAMGSPSLKGRLKRAIRKWRRKPTSPRTAVRSLTETEAAAAIEASGLFDAQWYLAKYPDVREAGAAPLEHFLHHGGAEGRKPGPGFDTRWYTAQSAEVAQSGLNPLVHYAIYGKAAGLSPMNGEVRSEDNPDVLLLLGSPLFDAEDYRARFPGIAKGRHSVARHYLDTGWRLGANPGPAFDGQRYLDRHSDVKEADVNPLVHYLRHGQDEGREIFSSGISTRRADSGPGAPAARPVAETASESPQPWAWTPLEQLGLDPSTPGVLRLGGRPIGRSLPGDKEAIDAVLATFETLSQPGAGAVVAYARFTTNPVSAVVDAWFVTTTTLRVRLNPTARFASVVRCYQADIGLGGIRLLAEQAVRTDGLPLFDVDLANPYASLLIAVDDGAGEVFDACIIAFPSLARNGDHHAELSASPQGAGPGSLIGHGSRLAREWINGAIAADLSLAAVEIDLDGAIGGERILASPFLVWLRGRMGIAISAAASRVAAGESSAFLNAQLEQVNNATSLSPRASRGGVLAIHGDALPTLQALVSRDLTPTADRSAGFIVADAVRGKPRWLVTPPPGGPDLSRLQPESQGATWPSVRGGAKTSSGGDHSAFPVAIRYQESSLFDEEAALLFPRAPDSPAPILIQSLPARLKKSPSVSVILTVAADLDTATALTTLSSVVGQDAGLVKEVILLLGEPREDLVEAAQAIAPMLRVHVGAGHPAGLNHAAGLASGAYILFVDAGVVLQDRRTLQTLLTMAAAPGVASASCALLEQASARNGHKVNWFSGGVFPTHIDLLGSPRLVFGEPRAPSALPAATYAVACNRMRLALMPVKLWKALGGLDEALPDLDYDLDLALRGLDMGASHLCTTAVAGLLVTRTAFSDSSDPGSAALLSPAGWSRVLGRITLLRGLG